MVEYNNENNELPVFEIPGDFDISAFKKLVEFGISHHFSEMFVCPDNRISAKIEDTDVEASDRMIFSFELSEVIKKLISREDEDLLRRAGNLSTNETFHRGGDRKVTCDYRIEYRIDGTYAIKVLFGKEMSTVNTAKVIAQSGTFAGNYTGDIFEIIGYMDAKNANDLLRFCGDLKASDITITADEFVVVDIGGKLHKVTDRVVTYSEVEECVRIFYAENGVAEVLAGNDLDTAYEVREKGQPLRRYRINITPGRMIGGVGIQITVRTLPSSPIPIDQLNVEEDILKNTRPTNGVILICGPTGSGKSTLLSSIVRMIVERPNANEKVLEYSSPIEYVYDDVVMPSSIIHQTHVGKHLKPRDGTSVWAHAARNSLRRKPTLIIIGEARDAETIEELVKISQEGHLTYSTMHTNSVAETINRAINVFPYEIRDRMSIDLMGALRLIVVQILIPKVGGGKVACREYMVFDPKTRERFLKAKMTSWPLMIQRMLSQKECVGETMIKSALKLLREGKISMETFEQIAEAGGRG